MRCKNSLHPNQPMTGIQQKQLFTLGKAFERGWYGALEQEKTKSEQLSFVPSWNPQDLHEILMDHHKGLCIDLSYNPGPSYEGDTIVDRWPDLAMVARIARDGRTTVSFVDDVYRSQGESTSSAANHQTLICTVKIDPHGDKPNMHIVFADVDAQISVDALPLLLRVLDTFDSSQTMNIARTYLRHFQAPLHGNEKGISTSDLAYEPLRGFNRYIVVRRSSIIDLLHCSCIEEARHYAAGAGVVYRIVASLD